MTLFEVALVIGFITCLNGQQQLFWRRAGDPRALCNDYTRAGFFLNRNPNSTKWIVFLESGSLCYSNDTCNRRFFNEDIRRKENFNGPGMSADFPFGRFDPVKAYNRIRNDNLLYPEFVSPLMTSMSCFQNRFAGNISVKGTDIMDQDPEKNPDFFDHNHVIIPYCSSDLWLGEEEGSVECSCSNLTCFDYKPDSSNLQFTFRGKTIFQSIFNQLQTDYGMDSATEILIAGSSAGGVGVLNHAQWVQKQILPSTNLLVMFDSSWFINFQESIYRIFDGTLNSKQSSLLSSQGDSRHLLSIIASNPACSDLFFGYPCCISAHCIMTRRNETGQLAYYPETNQRTFAIFSLYDTFLLAPALEGQSGFTSSNNSPDGQNSDDVNLSGLLINFLRIIGEYGGEMNATASMNFFEVPFLSYYSTQCFQHVYLATSTLWGTIFSSVIDVSGNLASFSHTIENGRWSQNILSAKGPDTSRVTIQQAVSEWYNNNQSTRFTDSCQGPYCNMDCPDKFVLIELTSNNWPSWIKILIAAIVACVPIVCIVMKGLFVAWLFILERKQLGYLDSIHDVENGNGSKFELMECDDKDKIAVSCLDLSYSITYKITKKIKDESQDEINNTVALHDIPEHELTEGKRKFTRTKRTGFARIKQTFRHPDDNRMRHQTHKQTNSLKTIIEDESLTRIEEGNEDSKGEEDDTFVQCFREWTTKEILKGISLYFNPKQMIGVMGPSGCGKTTFLDILTGRRRKGKFSGNIYVNGFPLSEVSEWYIANTGYVLQLAAPFYSELTVRDNLTLAAQITLGRDVAMKDKFKRVELVMNVTGLDKLADIVVGGEVGPGLSGGQKRRLVVALQLLKMPSVIFLDEPTSGLDATSSMELLYHLDLLAKSGRTVILTIHQPRMEIFHMFDKLVLLSDGKVAYHGAPEKAYEVFVSALLRKRLNYSSLKEQNPADVIMDMLGKTKLRKTILEYYETLDEPNKVRKAVEIGINKEESTRGLLQMALFGAKNFTKSSSRTFVRLAALEARAVKRLTFGQIVFLPIMFFLLAFILGTVYLQRTDPAQIVPAMAVFSCASGLYVFPAIELYYSPAIRLFGYEKANGIGRAQDLIVQGFVRYITIAFFPVLMSTSLMYLLLIKFTEYSLIAFVQVLVVNICLNLTWTALLIALIMTFPIVAFRLSSVIASLAGFASGFFIPIGDIHWGYRWIAYINPNYYALSAVTFFMLEDFNVCNGTQFECFFSSGQFILRRFFFDKINPYLHIVVLLFFTVLYLGLAILANWGHHTRITTIFKRMKSVFARFFKSIDTRQEASFTIDEKSGWAKVKEALPSGSLKSLAESGHEDDDTSKGKTFSFLSNEEGHKVWKPKYKLADIVAANMKERTKRDKTKKSKRDKTTKAKSEREMKSRSTVTSPPILQEEQQFSCTGQKSISKPFQAVFLQQRQKTLMNRVNFAWKVLKEKQQDPAEVDTAASSTIGERKQSDSAHWKAAARKAMISHGKQTDFSVIVANLAAKSENKEV